LLLKRIEREQIGQPAIWRLAKKLEMRFWFRHAIKSPKMVEYHTSMKPTPDTKAFRNFTAAMQTILTVSKVELLEREKQAKEARKAKRASARASRDKG
jgi:hypothetical protein